jgi:exonuclease III
MPVISNNIIDSLKIASWNCQGLKSNICGIKDLMKSADIIFLQEIWLEEYEGSFIQSIDRTFGVKFLSGMDPSREKNRGRPFGGVAILWKKAIIDNVGGTIYGENRRILGVELVIGGNKFKCINVYAPCEYKGHEDPDIYEFWGQLNACIELWESEKIIIGGDFNTDYNRSGEHLDMFQNCIEENGLYKGDKEFEEKVTYVSKINGTSSWIDHFMVTKEINDSLVKADVLNQIVGSDHYPLRICLKLKGNINLIDQTEKVQEHLSANKPVNWSMCNKLQREQYAWEVTEILKGSLLPQVFTCNSQDCKLKQHKADLQGVVKFLNEIMKFCEQKVFSEGIKRDKKGKKRIPGWEDLVKEKYKDFKEANLIWFKNGRQKEGTLLENRQEKHKIYKAAIRFCKTNEKQLRISQLAKNNRKFNQSEYWKEINKLRAEQPENIERIDGYTKKESILENWRNKFQELGNCVAQSIQVENKRSKGKNVHVDKWEIHQV